MKAPVYVMLEKDLQAGVIDLAHVLGYRVAHFRPAKTSKGWRTPVAADGAGWPDLLIVRDRTVAIELKSATGKLRPEQRDWLQALTKAGMECYVIRDRNLQHLAPVLAARLVMTAPDDPLIPYRLSTDAARAARHELLQELHQELDG